MNNFICNKKGNVIIWAPVIILVILTISMSIFEYTRLNIVAQGSRDAVQAAITQVCTENYDQLYNGLREGYAGGYKLDSMSWSENVDTSDIMTKLDTKLGTHSGEKTTGGKTEYWISNLSVNIKNALLAPMDTNNVQQFTGSATYKLTVPLYFGWQSLPPMVIPITVTAGYSPKGTLTEDGGDGSDDNPVSGITLNESSLTLEKGEFASLLATVYPDDAADPSISWISSDNRIATVNQSGLVAGVDVGTTAICAISQGHIARCEVTVTSPVTNIKLNKNNLTLYKGTSETLIATITPESSSNKSLWWTTSNTNICTVDASGKVTAVNPGTAEIQVQSTQSGVMDRCIVTVKSKMAGIYLNKNQLSMDKGASETLIATITPDDATNKGVLWATSKSSICTVDQSGKVTAIESGTAIVTATTMDGQYVAQCNVTVKSAVIIPTAPTSLWVTCNDNGIITMSWPASSQGTNSPQFKYNVYVDGSLVGTTTATSYSFAYSGGSTYSLPTETDKSDKNDVYVYKYSGKKRNYKLGVQGVNELGSSAITTISNTIGYQTDTTTETYKQGIIIYVVKLDEDCEYSKGIRHEGYSASCYGDDYYDLDDAKNWKDYCSYEKGDWGVFSYNGDPSNADYGYLMVGTVQSISHQSKTFTQKDTDTYYYVD